MAAHILASILNDRILEDKSSASNFAILEHELRVRGANYRLTEDRVSDLKRRVWRDNQDYSLTRITSGTGRNLYDRTLGTSLRPAILSDSVISKFCAIGKVVTSALTFSDNLYRSDEWVRRYIGRSSRSEVMGAVSGIPAAVGLWLRLDFVLRAGSETPTLVDVNINPGMAFINQIVFEVFDEVVSNIYPDLNIKEQYKAELLVRGFRKYFESHTSNREESIAILVREEHGLYPDMVTLAELFHRQGSDAKVVLPQDVTAIDENGLHAGSRTFRSVVRMFRRNSKHAHSGNVHRDESLFDAIFHAWSQQWISVVPSFHSYVEDHLWSWFWRAGSYKRYFEDKMGVSDYRVLFESLPRSCLIEDGMLVWDDGCAEPLSEDALRNTVVKSGDSAGARGVEILRKSTKSQRQKNVEVLQANARPPVVIQEHAMPHKEYFPEFLPGHNVRLRSANVQYSAYFSAGDYIGSHALACPYSLKCHGGVDTWHMPLLRST